MALLRCEGPEWGRETWQTKARIAAGAPQRWTSDGTRRSSRRGPLRDGREVPVGRSGNAEGRPPGLPSQNLQSLG
jgi:hypothetical protein